MDDVYDRIATTIFPTTSCIVFHHLMRVTMLGQPSKAPRRGGAAVVFRDSRACEFEWEDEMSSGVCPCLNMGNGGIPWEENRGKCPFKNVLMRNYGK